MSPTDTPSILIVEDDPDTAELILETLSDHLPTARIAHADRVEAALAHDLHDLDIVLSDMNLPDGTGLDFLDGALQARPSLPIVFVTGEGVLEHAIEAIRRGAYDYVVKAGDYLFTLPVIVEKNLAQSTLKAENEALRERLELTLAEVRVKNEQLESAVQKLETMAATDPLTGLANRRSLGMSLERRFADSQRRDRDLALVMIDLDGFKQLNDTLGHQDGDRVLQLAAEALQTACRKSDVAGRFGGDEFVLVLPDAGVEEAQDAAERVAAAFAELIDGHLARREACCGVTMSQGVATRLHSGAATPEELIAHADHALYRAKAAGKQRTMVYSPSAQA
ncbi:MAG: diguanylate cyclase [Planctomycetota bacterium]